MKVLTVAATPFFSNRGCHIRIYNEVKYLQKLGAFVEVCTYHVGEDIEGIVTHRIGNVSWYKKASPGFAWGKLWLDLKLLFLCVKVLRKADFDVIHAHLFEGLAIAKIAKYLTFKKIPIVLDLQGDLSDELASYNEKNNIIGKIFIWISKIVFRWADSIVVSSQNSYEKIKEKYEIIKPLLIVQDGVDLELFNSGVNQNNFSNQAELNNIKNWKGDSKIIFYGGGMSDNKGIGELLSWFVENYKKVNYKLVLFGKGDDIDKYKDIVNENDLKDRVWFTKESGYFELPEYLKMADVGIDPKKNSSESSAKMVTYMAVGLPVICFNNEFNKKILSEKGFYFDEWNNFDLKLSDIEKNDFSEKISYNLKEFSEERQVELLFDLFKKVSK